MSRLFDELQAKKSNPTNPKMIERLEEENSILRGRVGFLEKDNAEIEHERDSLKTQLLVYQTLLAQMVKSYGDRIVDVDGALNKGGNNGET